MDTLTTVLSVIAVLCVALYYYKQYKNYVTEQQKQTWPINISACPDYWVHEGDNKCKNPFGVGQCPKGQDGEAVVGGTQDFSSNLYQGLDGKFEKCKWAKTCNTSWEGIDNLCG